MLAFLESYPGKWILTRYVMRKVIHRRYCNKTMIVDFRLCLAVSISAYQILELYQFSWYGMRKVITVHVSYPGKCSTFKYGTRKVITFCMSHPGKCFFPSKCDIKFLLDKLNMGNIISFKNSIKCSTNPFFLIKFC